MVDTFFVYTVFCQSFESSGRFLYFTYKDPDFLSSFKLVLFISSELEKYPNRRGLQWQNFTIVHVTVCNVLGKHGLSGGHMPFCLVLFI